MIGRANPKISRMGLPSVIFFIISVPHFLVCFLPSLGSELFHPGAVLLAAPVGAVPRLLIQLMKFPAHLVVEKRCRLLELPGRMPGFRGIASLFYFFFVDSAHHLIRRSKPLARLPLGARLPAQTF